MLYAVFTFKIIPDGYTMPERIESIRQSWGNELIPQVAGVNTFMHNCSEKLETDNCLCCKEIQTLNFISVWASGIGLLSHVGNDDYPPKSTLDYDLWGLQTFITI